jgi:hypothetical protein
VRRAPTRPPPSHPPLTRTRPRLNKRNPRSYDEFGRLKRRTDADRAAREAAALARLHGGGSHAPSSAEPGGYGGGGGGYGSGGGGRDYDGRGGGGGGRDYESGGGGGRGGYERERERDYDRPRGGGGGGGDRRGDERGRDYGGGRDYRR